MFDHIQANYGGIKGKIQSEAEVEQTAPEQVEEDRTALDSDEDEHEVENEVLNKSDEEDSPEIEMTWNIMHFLPTSAACQTNFNVSSRLE